MAGYVLRKRHAGTLTLELPEGDRIRSPAVEYNTQVFYEEMKRKFIDYVRSVEVEEEEEEEE